jgi:hypothetical protein
MDRMRAQVRTTTKDNRDAACQPCNMRTSALEYAVAVHKDTHWNKLTRTTGESSCIEQRIFSPSCPSQTPHSYVTVLHLIPDARYLSASFPPRIRTTRRVCHACFEPVLKINIRHLLSKASRVAFHLYGTTIFKIYLSPLLLWLTSIHLHTSSCNS